MGTISKRPRADGTIAYRAEIVMRRDGKRHKFTATFDREAAAQRWVKRKEAEIHAEGGLDRALRKPKADVTLAAVIDAYTADLARIGRTKAQVLRALKAYPVADKECRTITADDLVGLARDLRADKQPQTVANYMSHLSAVFAVAKVAWGYDLDRTAMQDAMLACKRLGLTSKSAKRDRRPTVGEMNRLMAHFEDRWKRGRSLPMHKVCAFALFSTRRQEEITRIRWADYEPEHDRILVRDMKHPGEKIGNDVWCELPPEDRWYRRDTQEVGQRQFVVPDPDGYLLRFAEPLGTRPLRLVI